MTDSYPDPYSPDYPLWALMRHAGDSAPGTPRDAAAAEIRALASWVEDRCQRDFKQVLFDVKWTCDLLRSEADKAEESDG